MKADGRGYKGKSGHELIAAERVRQVEVYGFDAGHDDQHTDESIVCAALYFAMPSQYNDLARLLWPDHWGPTCERRQTGRRWSRKGRIGRSWSRKGRIQDLVKAGALITAEIDRIQRMYKH